MDWSMRNAAKRYQSCPVPLIERESRPIVQGATPDYGKYIVVAGGAFVGGCIGYCVKAKSFKTSVGIGAAVGAVIAALAIALFKFVQRGQFGRDDNTPQLEQPQQTQSDNSEHVAPQNPIDVHQKLFSELTFYSSNVIFGAFNFTFVEIQKEYSEPGQQEIPDFIVSKVADSLRDQTLIENIQAYNNYFACIKSMIEEVPADRDRILEEQCEWLAPHLGNKFIDDFYKSSPFYLPVMKNIARVIIEKELRLITPCGSQDVPPPLLIKRY